MTDLDPSLRLRRAARTLALGAAACSSVALPTTADAAVTRTTLAGPSANLAIPGNDRLDVDVAPDGSAAVAFRQQVGGVDHAFVSRYVGGAWSAPVQVDAGLAAPSARPSVAVSNGGQTVVVFPSGTAGNEKLYAASAPTGAAPFGAPAGIQLDPAGWKGADLEVAGSGDGYLTVYEGFNLHAYRVQGSTFTPVGAGFPSPAGILNAAPGEQAESGDQRGAHVAVDAAGATATIAWTETSGTDYKLWARRLSGTAPGQIGAAVDGSVAALDGKPGVGSASDMNSVTVGGDGRAWVAFRAGLDYNGTNIGRAVVRPFDGTSFGPAQVIDGLPAAPAESAEFPRLATNASGAGLAADYRQLTFGTEAATLAAGGSWTTATSVAAGTNLAAGRAAVALGDAGVGLVAMYAEPTAGQGQVLGRISGGPAAGTLETLSDPTLGPAGLPNEAGAGGGHAITAFQQGTGATTRIVAAVVPLPEPAPAPAPGSPAAPANGGSPGAPGTAPALPPAASTPVLSDIRFRSVRLKRTTKAPRLVPSTSKRRTLQFTLDRAATVELTVKRVRPGRLSKGRCVSAKGKPVGKRQRCDHETRVKGVSILRAPEGTSHVQFAGTLRAGRKLPAGSYVLYIAARTDSSAATPVRAPFRLRR